MFCRECGGEITDGVVFCSKCGVATGIRPPGADDIGQNPTMRLLLPVGRSGYAVAAGYLGLFSLFVIPAPLAIVFGFLAVRDIGRNPKKHGMGRAVFGIIMGALGTIVMMIGALLLLVSPW